MIKMKEKDNTGDGIENASLLIKKLLQNNDPVIQKMINWFVKKGGHIQGYLGKSMNQEKKNIS